MGVKVHLLKRVAGPSGNFPAGRTIEVSESEAKGLVAAGAAERIAGMRPYVEGVATTEGTEGHGTKGKRETATEKAVSKRETAVEK